MERKVFIYTFNMFNKYKYCFFDWIAQITILTNKIVWSWEEINQMKKVFEEVK